MSWNVDEEKLLCFMLLHDSVAHIASISAGDAFWRAFIVKNRKTGEIKAMYRMKYNNGHRNWYEIIPNDQISEVEEMTVTKLRAVLEDVILTAFQVLVGKEFEESPVEVFYPPDDDGDPQKVIKWMVDRDLLTIHCQDEVS